MLLSQSVAAPSDECERRLKAGMVLFPTFQVKLCDPCLSALRTRYLLSRVRYISTYLYLYLDVFGAFWRMMYAVPEDSNGTIVL